MKAWAIRCGLTDFDREMLASGRSSFTGHGLLGIYNYPLDWDAVLKLKPVVTTKLFHSRKEARASLPHIRKSGWPMARVVRVQVDITEI